MRIHLGPRHTKWDGNPPRTFKIAVEEELLVDLRRRLTHVRWPDEISGQPWQYGTGLDYLRSLCGYWRDEYDWRAHEAALNDFPQFKVTIGDIEVHYLYQRGEGDDPIPLLLTHGWPGSFYEYHKLIPRLTRPSWFGGTSAQSFTVVVPSMPGHVFSFKPDQARFGICDIADTLNTLMVDVLGYPSYVAHGHDWGAFVATRLAYAHANHLRGIHITLLAIPRNPSTEPPRTAEEEHYQRQLAHWLREETGYSQMMGTKPQTLAYALTDSPIGLAAWIVEKFRNWSDCGGDVDKHLGRDVLLTNIMLYWLTGAIGSSFWPYYARLHEPWIVPDGNCISVPTGYAEHPREILKPPRSLAEPFYTNIQQWSQMPRGGHFPALEAPDALAADIRKFASQLR